MTIAVFIGDSITAGGGAIDAAHAYCFTTGLRLGWTVIQKGLASTGWLNRSVAPPNGNNYDDRLTVDVIANTPDIVVFQGSVNDLLSIWSPAEIATAAALTVARVRAALPSCQIILLGLLLPPISAWSAVAPAWNAAMRGVGDIFIDPMVCNWFTGTGKVGAPTGDGNSDIYASAGGWPHPSQAGHDYLGTRLAYDIQYPLGNGIIRTDNGALVEAQAGVPLQRGF